jgi:glycosyltransferase involved in cell wall biosynthesis
MNLTEEKTAASVPAAALPPTISAIMPAHNESGNIVAAVNALVPVVSQLARDWEIVVVDDGSQDDTARLVQDLAREQSRIRLARHERNLGYGAAVKTGISQVQHQLIFITDADLQFDPLELKSLVPLAEEYDIVLGYRQRRREHAIRRLNAWCWGRLMRLLFGLRVQDINCAFKVFRGRIFDRMTICSRGALVYSEILIQAQRMGCTITQVPVTHYPRTKGHPSGAKVKTIYRAFADLMRLYRRLKR